MLPIFVINLDRRPNRWKRITETLERLDLPARRIPAIDAQCPGNAKHLNQAIPDHWSQIRVLDPGSIACALSHRRAVKAFLVETDAEAALFLEDDAELSSELPLFVKSVDWWPQGTQLIKLESWGWNPRYDIYSQPVAAPYRGRELRHILLWTPGGGAYLLRRPGAEFLLSTAPVVDMPIDTLLFDLRVSQVARDLRPIQVVPGLATQRFDEFESDLQETRKLAPRLPRKHLLRRALRLMPYKALIKTHRLMGKAHRVSLRFADSADSFWV